MLYQAILAVIFASGIKMLLIFPSTLFAGTKSWGSPKPWCSCSFKRQPKDVRVQCKKGNDWWICGTDLIPKMLVTFVWLHQSANGLIILRWMWNCNIYRANCVFFIFFQVWMKLWYKKLINFCNAGDAIILLYVCVTRIECLYLIRRLLSTSYVAIWSLWLQ